MNTFKVKNKMPFLAALLAALAFLPGSAFAEVIINGPGGVNGGLNAWDVFVFGNGRVITDILRTVSLFMTGSGGYKTVMLTIAMTGFVVAAVKAGFLGSSHFTKMVGYMLMVAFMVFCTFSAKMNVIVNDPISGSYTTVQKVPLIVAGPPVFVTQVGFYFTESIESFFDIPDAFKTASGARGEGASRFNLFAKVAGDMDRFVLTDPAIKRTISAYYADCTIPAIARGRLSSNEMNASPDLVATLEKAAFNSVLTKYFAPTDLSQSNATAPGLGEVSTCRESYDQFKADLDIHAANLVSAQADQWKSTGVSVTNETALTALMEQLGATGGANAVAGYSSASGLARQKAMLSYNSAAYRDAAASLGNNELLTGLSIAQAEQAQRTNWFVAAEMFNNLMGYVYITLQAFMFAIIPLIFIGFVIPGLGGKLLVNYAQILIWLALWMPSLAIVNYLVTMFGMGELTQSWSAANGITIENNRTISEYTSNLTMAGAFLGTLVPMITWGLVKGGMAFSEFISAGLASGMAGTAASTIASGNMSMNNISTDNTSMNKFNTAMSSTIGTQTTMGYMNSGAGTPIANKGGLVAEGAGGTIGNSVSSGGTLASSTNLAGTAGSKIGAGNSSSLGNSARFGRNGGNVDSSSDMLNTSVGNSYRQGVGKDESGGLGVNHALSADVSADGSISESKSSSLGLTTGAKPADGGPTGVSGSNAPGNSNGPALPGAASKTGPAPQVNNRSGRNIPGVKSDTGLGANTVMGTSQNEKISSGIDEKGGINRDYKNNASRNEGAGIDLGSQTSLGGGNSRSGGQSGSVDGDAGSRRDASSGVDSALSAGWQEQATKTQGYDSRMNADMTSREVNAMMQQVEGSINAMSLNGRMADMFGSYQGMDSAAQTAFTQTQADSSTALQSYTRQTDGLIGAANTHLTTAQQQADSTQKLVTDTFTAANTAVDNSKKDVVQKEQQVRNAANNLTNDFRNGNPLTFSDAQIRLGGEAGVVNKLSGVGETGVNPYAAGQGAFAAGGIVLDFIGPGKFGKLLKRGG